MHAVPLNELKCNSMIQYFRLAKFTLNPDEELGQPKKLFPCQHSSELGECSFIKFPCLSSSQEVQHSPECIIVRNKD